MTNSKKISQFNVSSSLSDSDLFTFVRSGTNINIPYSSVKADLGVTGSLSQTGDSLGAPVLNTVSENNYEIRNLESSKGVLATVSAQNGINLACNFEQATTGTKLIPDLNASKYKVKTLQGGEGVSIADDGDTLTFSSTGVATPSNLRFIASEADFDNQTATTITLTPGIFYQIGASFSTSKNIIGTGAVLEGLSAATTLTYTGTGSMFTAVNGVFRISSIFIDCPNGTAFTCIGDDTGNINHRINATSMVILNCNKILDSIGAGGFVFDIIQATNMPGSVGFSFSSTVPAAIWSFNRIAILGMTAGAIGFDFGSSVSSEIEISDTIMFGDSTATAISGLPNSGNISSGNLATVTGCNFSSFAIPLSGISSDDARWEFTSNAGVTDSLSDALLGFNANTTETVITTINTPVITNAVWVLEDIRRFSATTGGRATYISEQTKHFPVDIAVGVISVGGGSTDITVYLALNGSVITNTGRTVNASGSTPRTLSIPWQLDLSENDYLEVFVENNSGTNNIIVESAILRVN